VPNFRKNENFREIFRKNENVREIFRENENFCENCRENEKFREISFLHHFRFSRKCKKPFSFQPYCCLVRTTKHCYTDKIRDENKSAKQQNAVKKIKKQSNDGRFNYNSYSCGLPAYTL
jgi:hypothetical protein